MGEICWKLSGDLIEFLWMQTSDPSKFKYIDPENLVASLKTVGKNMAVSTDRFELWSDYLLQDLEWNAMDQHHRPHVHSTYNECARIVLSESMTLSLTKAGPWPFFVMLTDIRLKPGFYYQGYTLLGIWYVHCVQYAIPKEGRLFQQVDFHVLSHRFFKFMHRPILKRLIGINEKLNKEDFPIRHRRLDLRKKGYKFLTDQPDFLNSNRLTDNVVPPKGKGSYRFGVGQFSETLKKISAGPVDLLVKKDSAGLSIWPEACPHEGGPLADAQMCDKQLVCPWHHLKFSATVLTPASPRGSVGGVEVFLENNELVAQFQVSAGVPVS